MARTRFGEGREGTQSAVETLERLHFDVSPAVAARSSEAKVLRPYETPGTQAFADTVIPFVRDYNTILLSNHGVVCWSDTVTDAEWLVEILDTYCRTWVIAGQIGRPRQPIPEEKLGEILELKRKAGLPDVRFADHSQPADGQDSEMESFAERVATWIEHQD